MRLDTILDELIRIIKGNSYFDNIKVIKAYPSDINPTRLGYPYIAVGLSEIDMQSSGIDSAQRSGQISVFADVYVSGRQDCTLIYDIFTRLCEVLSCFNVLSIKASRMQYDTYTQANVLKGVITFDDEITFGGALNE